MRTRACLAFCLLVSALLFAGCGKLNDERTVRLETGDVKSFHYDPPPNERRVTVVVTPGDAAVDVYLVTESEHRAAEESLLHEKKPAKTLASKENVSREETVEATVPAKTAFAVLLCGARKNTQVKLKVTGQ
jgi:hypothetical protein